MFMFSQTVTDFVAATYNNTLTVTGNFPGNYTIYAWNRNTEQYFDSIAATSILLVEGETIDPSTNITYVAMATLYHASVHETHASLMVYHRAGCLEAPPVAKVLLGYNYCMEYSIPRGIVTSVHSHMMPFSYIATEGPVS